MFPESCQVEVCALCVTSSQRGPETLRCAGLALSSGAELPACGLAAGSVGTLHSGQLRSKCHGPGRLWGVLGWQRLVTLCGMTFFLHSGRTDQGPAASLY